MGAGSRVNKLMDDQKYKQFVSYKAIPLFIFKSVWGNETMPLSFYICIQFMKLFVHILSFYIMVLTAIPCIDKPVDHSLQKSVISSNIAGTQHHEIDHCSPFCTCNCCSSSKIQKQMVIEFNCAEFFLACFSEQSPSSVSAPPDTVWQPPRLS